jgi:hypothetical protein
MSGGIFIAEGMTFAITEFSITIEDDGSASFGGAPKVGFDACIPWLRIALEHLAVARALATDSGAIWSGNDEQAKGALLGKQFRSSMQAIVAAGVAVDAFYSKVDHSFRDPKVPRAPQPSGRRRTSRYAHVAECLRRAFTIRQQDFGVLRNYLKQIYGFRDKGVHPSGGLSDPVLHPEMKAGIEGRFVTFRYGNAYPIVKVVVEMISEFAGKGHSTNKQLQDYCTYLKQSIAPIRSSELLSAPLTET